MNKIDSPYKYITSLYDNINNYTNKRTPKQQELRQEYLIELQTQLENYEKEKKDLLDTYSKLDTTNSLIIKKINYYKDKLHFRNIRNSSTSNFISLNSYSLKNKLNTEIELFNNNYRKLNALRDKLNRIDFNIYNVNLTLQYYY
jgi:hypothetical protein